ncbi:MAG: family 10 glycosylhydrolase [Oscillatoriaceae bacterium SKW80]|nr:family 10 glycosylhydrolase [Oscillatoriaceae bacterium SKYG93]MCX8119996.1 family 10 glycosylhydrolase [Oscillatoriaceae bacterium SKW80]MDW8454157.1 family 10 glycosylhydrolase [Oscillatoriaceae cyanobacterium SKYGB_i_bin93]
MTADKAARLKPIAHHLFRQRDNMNLKIIILRFYNQLRLVIKDQKNITGRENQSTNKTNRKKGKILIFALSLLFGFGVTQIYAAFPPAGIAQQPETTPQLVNVSHPREFRGVWVATVANIDWPSKRGLPVEQQKAELIQILDQMQALNMNALILQIRPAGDAFYASELEPWSIWLTGTQGKPPQPYYDPLQFAIEESHKRNIELHAWFNPYRARAAERTNFAPNHVAVEYPEYVYQYGDLLWMDPGAKVIEDKTYNVIMDVVRRYNVDGIHFDDYFYPYPKDGIEFPDSKTYNAYRAAGGTLSLADWRRDNVNRLIQRIYQGIRAEKPNVKFGISPFGIYRPGQPPGIVGLDQYNALYADAKKWLEEGWVDYMAPQLYWRIDPPQQSYPVLLNWWTQNNPKGRHIYAGNYLSKLDGGNWSLAEFQRQVDISRSKADRLSLGNIFFSMKVFRENRLGVNNAFRNSIYRSPALPPTMPWLDNEPPAPPTGVVASVRQLSWNPAPSDDIRSWTLYKQIGNNWELIRILPAAVTAVQVEPGTYALSAVDKMENESLGVVAYVQ